jgi:hypothetical protein
MNRCSTSRDVEGEAARFVDAPARFFHLREATT